ncbi:MAG: metalloregulator ArsR/SmtB family transcription factor [Planctomycetota bacterium]
MKRAPRSLCCPPKSAFLKIARIPPVLVVGIRSTFAVLASATRIRLLHALAREGEAAVGELAGLSGLKIAAASNQLRRMAAQGVVGSRREGKEIYYFMVDPCVGELLDRGACLAIDARRRTRAR